MGNCCCCCCSKKGGGSDDSGDGGMKKKLIDEQSPTFNALGAPSESVAPGENNDGAISFEPTRFNINDHSDDTTSKKVKSTTNTTNELRIFLPHINDNLDKSWIPPDVTRSYRDSLQLVTLAALNGNSTPEPNHEDKYVIGSSNYAVKLKSGKILEVNARKATTPIWMETWIKTKFGKKNLSDHKPEVMDALKSAGHTEVAHDHIDSPKFLSVIKSKNAWKVKDIAIEVVELSIPVRSDNCVEVKRTKWLSIAVQGEHKAIEEFILHSHSAKDLWKCFTIAKRIYSQNPTQALSTDFVPVVSGYPLWLRLCANLVDQQEAEKEVIPNMEALIHFLK